MSKYQQQAEQIMSEAEAEATRTWEQEIYPQIQQATLEAGGGEAGLRLLEQQLPQLRDSFLTGVAVGVILMVKKAADLKQESP